MKKYFSLMLLFATLFITFTACDDEPKDTLNGTEWTHWLSEGVEHLEFTSDTQVVYYRTKDDAITGKVISGNYTKSGNDIMFRYFEDGYDGEKLKFKWATLRDNMLTVYYNINDADTRTIFHKAK